MTGRLAGRRAIVTGGGRGIGQQVVLRLAAEGAVVLVNDRDEQPAHETVELVRSSGGTAHAAVGSITDDGAADALVATAVDRLGGIDVIVNNAGYTWDSVVQRTTDEQWATMLDLHLTAPFRILRAAQPVIAAAARAEIAVTGRALCRKVVSISSVSGLAGNPGQAAYASAKAGLTGLTRTLAREWGRYNVTVNAVAFGLIETRLTASVADGAAIDVDGRRIPVGVRDDILEAAAATIPLGRAGTPFEAAGAVALLCYPESDYVSGETLVCGGGWRG